MRRYLVVLAAAAVCVTGRVAAQVSVEDVRTDKQDRVFENDIKTQQVGADYYSEARYRAERAAIRKERNALEFTSNLQGSLTAFSESWQASGDNAIAILANVNFKHVFTKGAFSITTAAVAKFGYNRMKAEFTDEAGAKYEEGVWFKNVDEISISTSPQWKNWSYGTIIKFRTQFAEGYSARTDKRNSKAPISNFMAPGYLDISGGFTYTLPSERFPLKVNLAPIALSAVYVEDDSVSNRYGVKEGKTSKYEGGFSVQLDFDRTWGKNGWLRYRSTAFSFYGWITDISSSQNFAPTPEKDKYRHVLPTVRWENTIDIKASKFLSTQIYFQLYYNDAERSRLQMQTMLSVGLTYTFKNK
mgnify:FL=1